MAMTSLVIPGLVSSQLGSQNQLKIPHKWVFFDGVYVGKAMRLVKDENPWKPAKLMVHVVDHGKTDGDVSHGLHKDLGSLPSGFSLVYLSLFSRLY